jgi:hypothetical protein
LPFTIASPPTVKAVVELTHHCHTAIGTTISERGCLRDVSENSKQVMSLPHSLSGAYKAGNNAS